MDGGAPNQNPTLIVKDHEAIDRLGIFHTDKLTKIPSNPSLPSESADPAAPNYKALQTEMAKMQGEPAAAECIHDYPVSDTVRTVVATGGTYNQNLKAANNAGRSMGNDVPHGNCGPAKNFSPR